MDKKLAEQLSFLLEADKMKAILRQTLVSDGTRRENDAEHSWHLALCAMTLSEYAAHAAELNVLRVLKMALVHDLIEIYAGDTFAFDEAAGLDKEKRESEAADRLFAFLPKEQGREYRELWQEFDTMETHDAKFAAAMDRLQPFMLNLATGGHTWKLGKVNRAKVYRRMAVIEEAVPAIWPYIEEKIEEAVKNGWIAE